MLNMNCAFSPILFGQQALFCICKTLKIILKTIVIRTHRELYLLVSTQAKIVLRRRAAEARAREDQRSQAEEAGQGHRHRRPRRNGPSQQRRRLRRAVARAAAAETAEQSVHNAESAAVKTANMANVDPNAGEAALHPIPSAQVAAEAFPPPLQPHPRDQNFWSVLRDELCPDKDYSTAEQGVLSPRYVPHLSHVSSLYIPQLDGYRDHDQDQEDDGWCCKCCRYAKLFDAEDNLTQHHEVHMVSYEECNICFTRHVWK
jgi:hypothetical protein